MIRLIIIEKDINLLNDLIKHFKYNKNIQIIYSTNDGLIGSKYIIENQSKIDIIIMNLIIKNKDGITLIKEIRERNINIPIIICTSCYSNNMISQVSSLNICAYLFKPYNIIDLENKIKDVINNEFCHKKIDERIMILLHSMGISSKYKGYKYLKESIRMFYFYPESIITKEIYCSLAIKYKVTKSCIERSISRAIDEGINRCNLEYIESIFGSTISLERGSPTNAEFIETITERLNIINQSMI